MFLNYAAISEYKRILIIYGGERKMEDIFLRKEYFEDKSWYNQFCLFLNIGVCKVKKEEVEEVMDVLEQMGYSGLRTIEKEDCLYITG